MAQEIRDVLVVYHTRTPCALLQGMVKRGDRGFSTGNGFYDWGATSRRSRRNGPTS